MSKFAFWGPGRDPLLEEFRAQLETEWRRRGYEFDEAEKPDAEVVFNFINAKKPKPFRRRGKGTEPGVAVCHRAAERDTPRGPQHRHRVRRSLSLPFAIACGVTGS